MVDPTPAGTPDAARPLSGPPGALTRGFLFCDLRDYTAFVERYGDRAAADLLEAYRTLVREAIRSTGGGEIRTEGDSFYVVFPSASAAVRCGLAIVDAAARASAEQPDRPIRVGVGIHAGESFEHREGYVGSAVNIAARVCAQASAGTVLVTDTVRSLVRTSLEVTFRSRGRPRLKGIAEPIALYEVTSGAAPAAARRVRPQLRGGPLVRGRSAWLPIGLVVAAVLVVVPAFAAMSSLGGSSQRTPAANSPGSGSAAAGSTGADSAAASSAASAAAESFDPAQLPGRILFISSTQSGATGGPSGRVYVANLDGTDRRPVTPLLEDVAAVVLSADGREIAYTDNWTSLHTVAIDGAGEQSEWPGTWADVRFKDTGEHLYPFFITTWLQGGDVVVGRYYDGIYYRLSRDGRSVTPLINPSVRKEAIEGEGFGVSPVEPILAFRSQARTGEWNVWISGLDGYEARQITHGIDAYGEQYGEDKLAWSPDGTKIAFRGQARTGGPIDIWVVDAGGSGLRQLTDDELTDGSPTWSPDGTWITWSRVVGGKQQLWVKRADGTGDAHQLPIGESGEQLQSPIWIPTAP